eukprot:TRINITY_DN11252_c0_g1_i1.p1 TRINITY_DN11252_c0_g1~~TRINITY_DN11252_c0_g1_i1.p1  ORF type:complete len:413 (+),score=76.96 TRINITY_DN11252_c0_g1_i1:66-1304(+)
MDAPQQAKVRELCGLTGVSEQQAVFYLESSGWDVSSAANTFFESGGGDVDFEGDPIPEEQGFPISASGNLGVQQTGRGASGASMGLPAVPTDRRGKGRTGGSGAGGRNKITTFNDLRTSQEDDSGSESDGPNEYYTGGEKSGMMVQDPNRPQRAVDAIFQNARQQGAVEGTSQDLDAGGSRRGGAFTGRGYTLSDEPSVATNEGTPTESTPPAVTHTITFWRNGFIVGDGPLRHFEDPENRPFLESINRGNCPRELEPQDRNTQVTVNMVKRDEDWTPPPEPRYRAFAGVGRTLGSTTTGGVSSSSGEIPAPTASGTVSGMASAGPAKGFEVDNSKPSTSITVRLLDGTRLVIRFNHHHTIGDLRQFIDAARPGSAAHAYGLYTGFPPKLLQDLGQTVEDAGLLNSVVIQKP